jgi:16S rRNA processing protein RimM
LSRDVKSGVCWVSEYITVGKITAPYGVQGAVKVIPLTDFPERFSAKRHYFLVKEKLKREVDAWVVGRRKRELIIKIDGIDTPEQAREYRNALLQVPREEVWPLPEGHFYHFQLIGLQVKTEEGTVLGTVVDILETGSNDVYVLKDEQGKEFLIPALKEVVKGIHPEEGLMLVRPLPGLLEG